jgi:hypothetical protein
MRIVILLAALALVAAGCGDDDERAAAPATLAELTVTVDADGNGAREPKTVDVRCEAAGDSKVCAAVADLQAAAFEPTPGDVACTEIYGGPQVATVNGTLRDDEVDARFTRNNGCEIARWQKVHDLLAAAG